MGRVLVDVQPAKTKGLGVSLAYSYFVLHMKNSGYADPTINTYNHHIGQFIKYLNSSAMTYAQGGKNIDADFPVGKITMRHVELYEGYCRDTRNNKDTTIQSYVKSIRAFLYWCMEEDQGFIEKPYKVKLPSAVDAMKEPYTMEEMAIILAEPDNLDMAEWRNWAAINVCLRTGLRLSSLVELKWTDIDYENKRLLMRHSKNKKQQFVPLPLDAIEVLVKWDEITPRTNDGYVFFNTIDFGKMLPNGLYQSIRKYNLRRGVEKTSVHLMRHTYATTYLRKGGSSDKLQKILGHATRDMTDKYVHFVTEDLTENIDAFTI